MMKRQNNSGNQVDNMRNLMTACIIAGLVLMPCLGSAGFGDRVTNSSPEVGLIVEDFANNLPSPSPFVQTPVQIGYWDIGPNWALFDEDDVLYLHIGDTILPGTTIRVNDIRLTNSAFGAPGSKVEAANADMEKTLTPFPAGLPRIVFVDEGGIMGQYDINESVYIKTVSPLGTISTGDIRLSPSPLLGYVAGSMVLTLHDDYGAACSDLHPGPSFNVWVPGARGKVRFYNSNGNVYINPGSLPKVWSSPPIYDKADDVYFDVSSPSGVPARNFGYITPNAIHLSG
jgi:hypothetical protein